MATPSAFIAAVPLDRLKVWVLAPYLVTDDANIDYYYDFSQSIAEYARVFEELDIEWKWQPVTLADYADVIQTITEEQNKGNCYPMVLNLCDGDEVNGTPGISVVQLLEQKELVYTGSDEFFYRITTSKIPMKKAFDKAKVPNATWEAILSPDQDTSGIFERLGSPIIVKPSVSGGSMGVGIKNVVRTEEELREQVQRMFEGYRGWNLAADGIIAESFIAGPEFTTMIVGSYKHPRQCRIYEPVERVFHASLPEHEKFLSFDRLWEIYEDETPMPGEENFYEYRLPDASLHEAIKQISLDAYLSVKGTGYTRIDIRMDQQTGKLYVLEVNAQCGISEDEDYTSIGAILRISDTSFSELVTEIINDAFRRKIQQPVIIKNTPGAPVVPLTAGRASRKKIK
jgi:D-alanine-D-alanine ligase